MKAVLAQTDLFAAPTLAGLSLLRDIVTTAEEQALIAAIGTVELTPFRFHGWLGKRLTATCGWRYDFDDAGFTPAPRIPDWLLPVRERAARLAGLAPDDLVQSLLIRYDPGAGIGWHRDRPVFEHVVGISLSGPAVMRFRQRVAGGFERVSVPLEPRAAYHLTGAARHLWEHSIAPIDVPRWSITFRSLSEKGRRVALVSTRARPAARRGG